MGGACIIHGRDEKYRILEGKSKGQIYVKKLGVDVRIKLKWFLKELKCRKSWQALLDMTMNFWDLLVMS
jgi:hypothetical protein